jgi:4a-hydroxytetrahydrobiopterin dehydratase
VKRLSEAEARAKLAQLKDWVLQGDLIVREYAFKDHYETMAFVNALAWVSHRKDHHPDLVVGYNRCRVAYSTHSVGGLSENDFACAAHCDALFVL